MVQVNSSSEREQLEQAIAAQEGLRGKIDDSIIDATIATLREKLTALEPFSQQRKQVTILFMDIAGHTALTINLDPEEQMEVVDSAIARLAGPVTRFGGHVARYQGDGYKAVFGLPVARENDPENAVRAALAIQTEAATIAEELEKQRGLSGFQVRVGLTTGLVFAGGETEGEDTIKGPPVNLAARLESAARPGTVLISHQTYQHVRGIFDVARQEPVQAKGFPEPVTVYQVLRSKPRPFYLRMRGVEGVETRMIGREGELKLLQDAYHRAQEDGEIQVVTVTGEAGLGKSRLLYEFENWVDLQPEFVRLCRGRAQESTQRLPFYLLRNLLAFRFEIREDDPAQLVCEKLLLGLQQALPDDPQVEMKAHLVGQLVGYLFDESPHIQAVQDDLQQIRDRSFKYLGEYFEALARSTMVLVLLEDLHWADDGSLDVLNQLFFRLSKYPILVITAARPSLFERNPRWGEGQVFHVRLDLCPLNQHDSRRLVEEILQKVTELADGLRDIVVDHAEGNPFYVEELIKMMVEQGAIVKDAENWHVSLERLDNIQVPQTLVGVLQARLERLPQNERTILQQASVIGRIFWDILLMYMRKAGADLGARMQVLELLASLRAKEIVFRRETSIFADAVEFLFKHDMLREVVYESVLLRLRRHYHAVTAAWLIENSQVCRVKYSGLIADHLLKADRHAEALIYLQQAGEQAAEAYVQKEAASYFSRALELVPEEALEMQWALHAARERAYDFLGERERQAHDLVAMEQLAAALGEAEKHIEALLRQANYANATGDSQATIEAARRAAALAGQAGDQEREARAHRVWGSGLWRKGEYSAAQVRLEQALALARETGNRREEGYALNGLGAVAYEQGDNSSGQAFFEQALDLARETGDRRRERSALNNLGGVAIEQGDYLSGQAFLEQALALARETGDRNGEAHALNNLGAVAVRHADCHRGQAYYEQVLDLVRETGDRHGEVIALYNLGTVADYLEDYLRAQEYLEQALALAREVGDRGGEGIALGGLCDALLGLGNPAEAVEMGRRAIRLQEKTGKQHMAMESRASLARAEQAQDHLAEAAVQVEAVLAYVDAGGSLEGTDPVRIYLTCAQVLQAMGDPRAPELLAVAHSLLQGHAAKITDEATRRSFFENIPWHREIMRLWGERGGN